MGLMLLAFMRMCICWYYPEVRIGVQSRMLKWVKSSARCCGWFGHVTLCNFARAQTYFWRAWQNSRSKIRFKGPSLKRSRSSSHYQILKFCQETFVPSSHLESWEVVPSCFKAAGRWLNRSADCMPEVAIKRYQACYQIGHGRGSLPWSPPEAYWANMKSEEYDVCCQPGKSSAARTSFSATALRAPLFPKLSLATTARIFIVEGSLVKLPTIWTDGKAQAGRVREGKPRSEKVREEKEWEERRCRWAKR